MNEKKLIAVIADDFTGAAECGGIGLRHGLNVTIVTEPVRNENDDLLVIATDTRSLPDSEAAEYIAQITGELVKYKPQFIFKKIDSVLRGNITRELLAQMKILDKTRSIIIAANPEFNRIIRDGKYYIDNIPLNETFFSSDTSFPIQSANVLQILEPADGYQIFSLKPGDELPGKGLIVGDVLESDDLHKWAMYYDDHTLFAGASGFFESLLIRLKITKKGAHIPQIPFGKNALFVLGSTFPKNTDLLKKMVENGHHLSNIPEEIYYTKNYKPACFDNWIMDVVRGIERQHKVIVSIIHPPSNEPFISLRMKEVIGSLVQEVTEKIELNELLIEGGSTTSEILKRLGITKLTPIQELDTGVIRMSTDNIKHLCLTTKPGSYLWPEKVWLKKEIGHYGKGINP